MIPLRPARERKSARERERQRENAWTRKKERERDRARSHLEAGALEASRERLGEAVHALGDLPEADGAVVHSVHGSAVGKERLLQRSG